jgi:hypothetical protein
MIGPQKRYLEHFWKWATKARDMVNGRIGPVPGRVLHLWHGELADRRYARLNQEFMTFDFDPEKHLRFDESGLWEWTDETPERLRKWASEMFWMRREDGDPALQPQAGAA